MNCFLKSKSFLGSCIAVIFGIISGFSQTSDLEEELVNSYGVYASVPQELIYLHTNKTDCLIGEQLGFKAYIIDKHTGKPASNTTNLYVQLVDHENNTYKEKLLQVNKGVAYGTFLIDDVFTTKNYSIKAFTNWSRNFAQPNIFKQSIRIVDSNSSPESRTLLAPDSILAVSFMPEGGHLLVNTLNSMGIQVRDKNGFGVPNLGCQLLDENNEVLKVFQLNERGLAKVLLTPKNNTTFKLSITNKNKQQLFNLPKAEERGLSVILINRKDKVLLNLNTNEAFLPVAKEHNYRLAIHNGSDLKSIPLPSFDTTAIAHNIPKTILFAGMNIFTVLDETNTPILERLYFHPDKEKIQKFDSQKIESTRDSIEIQLKYEKLSATGTLSISILPETSVANNAHQSIASFALLQSYLKQPIENAAGYFTEKPEFEKEVDLLLLTHGWSAYDWSNILHFSEKEPHYRFEKGIQATVPNKKNRKRNYIAFPHQGNDLRFLKPSVTESSFVTDSLFPLNEDMFRISKVETNGAFIKPIQNIKIEFSPNKIPIVDLGNTPLGYKPMNNLGVAPSSQELKMTLPTEKNTIVLDGVTVSENKINDQRLKNLIDFSHGKVTVFDDNMRKRWPDVITFLQMQNGVSITRRMDSITTNIGHVYLDGLPIKSSMLQSSDLSLLLGLSTWDIDYIEVNRFGIGEGLRGWQGVIRIFTRTDYADAQKKPYEYLDIPYPLTFSRPTTYSLPFYSGYTNEAYDKYGVVAWLPNLNLNENGEVTFTIPKRTLEHIRLNIQGILDNGDFISEERVIRLQD
jgi:hypothetical protein